MLASAAVIFCSKQEWSEPYQSNPENEVSKHDQLQSATPSSPFFFFFFGKKEKKKKKKRKKVLRLN
jgi:hypothetical protein